MPIDARGSFLVFSLWFKCVAIGIEDHLVVLRVNQCWTLCSKEPSVERRSLALGVILAILEIPGGDLPLIQFPSDEPQMGNPQ